MSIWQAFWLALLQGATEILPVSSLGHGVLLPSLLSWYVNQESPTFVPFFVVLHLGTAMALLVFFRREWASVVRGFFRTMGTTADCDDIDPYARHRHTSRCSYALIYGSEARQADDYKSALW